MAANRFDWDEPRESPQEITARLVEMRTKLAESIGADDELGVEMGKVLALQDQIQEHNLSDLVTWRRQAEQNMAPEFRKELAKRRAANDEEIKKQEAEADARLPAKLERRMTRLKQEIMVRKTESLNRRNGK